ncbi:MAG: hypothetical protein A3K19_24385 [Lentisphaerae bacterium RIFOXYB12_FULL_65_16]|nr:MAG: hypothetical protein A3K18_05470 [Lentisphaerae bacterium RIFOXYA12_64_32]OGV90589.1 MAG: hypothetical protein A3K19_24385 [Lentisphaerae bacterium RIFOXYB12_FULL_65_16]
MINIAFGFMANMKFSILPSEDDVAWRGYGPLFRILAEFPQLRADLFYRNNNYNLLLPEDMEVWFAELEQLKSQHTEDVLLAIGLDMEAPLVLEVQGYAKDGTQQFREFARRLAATDGVRFTLMGDYLREHPPKREVFIRHTTWHGYGHGFWGPDGSQKLISLCEAAERDILDCEDLLGDGAENPKFRGDLERAWEHLMAALVTDAHFTDRWVQKSKGDSYPMRYPVARVILGALDNALAARQQARDLKRALWLSKQ